MYIKDTLAIGYFGPVSERRWLVNHVNYNKSVTYSTFCYKKKNTKKNTRVVENRKKNKSIPKRRKRHEANVRIRAPHEDDDDARDDDDGGA